MLLLAVLRRLDDELRVYEYRSYFDIHAALEKNNNNYRQARNYLHWQERALYDKKVKRAEAEEETMQRALAQRRKLQLAPTMGEPTLRNPVAELLEGRAVHYTEEEVLQRHICRGFTARELKLDSRHLTRMPDFLASTIALQLGRYKSVSACLNQLSLLLSGDSPALSMRQFRNVVTLRLTSNQLQELPADIGLLQGLRTLALDNNNLNELPRSLCQLKNLTYLNLRQNRMASLPDQLGLLARLKHLDVAKNMLAELCSSFPGLTSLTFLDLSENKIQHLAILPTARSQLWAHSSRNCPLDWTAVVNEETGATRYFNKATGNMSSSLPSTLRDFLAVDQSSHATDDHLQAIASPAASPAAAASKAKQRNGKGNNRAGVILKEEREAAQRKRELVELAKAGKREWDTPVDYATGFMQYHNNISQQAQGLMPVEVDKLGWAMGELRVLRLGNNLLRALPDSMGGMTALESLDACNNYLRRIPTCLKKWTRMRRLLLTSNDLVSLPDVFNCLPELTELHLTSNLLQALPDTLGSCSKLCQLRLGNNQLTRLPTTFGYLSALRELQVFGNPIEDPPMHLITGNRDELLWLLRQKHKEALMGPPPSVAIHRSGVADERLCPVPGFMKELERLLQDPPGGPRTTADLRLKGKTTRKGRTGGRFGGRLVQHTLILRPSG